MRQAASSPTRYAGTTCRIILGRYTAPPSTLPATPFIFQVYNQQNGLKMQGQASLTATAKTYSLTITPTSFIINQPTSYTFDLITTDTILKTSMIDIAFPVELSPSVTANCLLTNDFSSPATPQCQLNSQTVRISNLSTADIPASTYTFTL